MKRNILLFLLLLPLSVAAQVKFGYLSYRTICREMPQYALAQKELQELKVVYEKEAARSEEDFQRKFADFLHGQKDFPTNILYKRQAELQDLMDKGIQFRKEAERLLQEAEQTMLKELYVQLDKAIIEVGMETGYSFILNIDDHAAPFINPLLGDDVSDLVRTKLGIPVLVPPTEETATSAENIQIPVEPEQQADAESVAPLQLERPQ